MTAAAWLFGAAGLASAGIGAYFIALRPALLPEDLLRLGRTADDIERELPALRVWLRRVFIVLGGHALAAGMLSVFVAATGVRDRNPAAVAALIAAGVVSIGLMAVVNFVIRSAFRWLLLGVAGLWLAGLLAAVVG